jgi:hypothetical protein
LSPLAANLIRTYTPIAVGVIASWLTARGIHVDPSTTAAAIVAMTGVFTAAYYTIARVLEERYPAVGAVLLLAKPAVHPAEPAGDPLGEDDAAWLSALHGDVQATLMRPAAPVPSVSLSHLAAPMPQPPEPTRPDLLMVRKADTGAIPVYKRPPGR